MANRGAYPIALGGEKPSGRGAQSAARARDDDDFAVNVAPTRKPPRSRSSLGCGCYENDQYALAIDSLVMFTMLSEVPISHEKQGDDGGPHMGAPFS